MKKYWRRPVRLMLLCLLLLTTTVVFSGTDNGCRAQETTMVEILAQGTAGIEVGGKTLTSNCFFVLVVVLPDRSKWNAYPGYVMDGGVIVVGPHTYVLAGDFAIIRFRLVPDIEGAQELAREYYQDIREAGLYAAPVF